MYPEIGVRNNFHSSTKLQFNLLAPTIKYTTYSKTQVLRFLQFPVWPELSCSNLNLNVKYWTFSHISAYHWSLSEKFGPALIVREQSQGFHLEPWSRQCPASLASWCSPTFQLPWLLCCVLCWRCCRRKGHLRNLLSARTPPLMLCWLSNNST